MEKEPAIQNQFRKLELELPPIRQENSLFWWLAGVALAVCAIALTLHYYALHKQQNLQSTPKVVVQQTALLHKETPCTGAL